MGGASDSEDGLARPAARRGRGGGALLEGLDLVAPSSLRRKGGGVESRDGGSDNRFSDVAVCTGVAGIERGRGMAAGDKGRMLGEGKSSTGVVKSSCVSSGGDLLMASVLAAPLGWDMWSSTEPSDAAALWSLPIGIGLAVRCLFRFGNGGGGPDGG